MTELREWVVNGNVVYLDTLRYGREGLVLFGMYGPRNQVLARWANIVSCSAKAKGNYMAFGETSHRVMPGMKRFLLPLQNGWVHCALAATAGLQGKVTSDIREGYVYDRGSLDKVIRKTVNVPLREGWGLLLGEKNELIRELNGFGQPAWGFVTSPAAWLQAVSDHLDELKSGIKE